VDCDWVCSVICDLIRVFWYEYYGVCDMGRGGLECTCVGGVSAHVCLLVFLE
jgi:hypothetical protein